MKTLLKPLSIVVCTMVALLAALPVSGQAAPPATAIQPRITAPVDNASRVTLANSRPPRAVGAEDMGAVPDSMKLESMSLVFSKTAAQQAELDALVAAQQNPASPMYHQWLTPSQFAARFGVADADIAAVETWLEQQGFSVDSVSHSRNRIMFSGTAGQVASAFEAPLHFYKTPASGGRPAATHFAPSADLTVPAALGSSVLTVENLSDFRPRSHVRIHPAQVVPRFTSSQTGDNFLSPADVSTIYDIAAATGAGYTGTGQTIVIVGQSAVQTTDLSDFQTAAGIPAKLPTMILVPGTGTSTINPVSGANDEVESDLDLEYSDAIAQGATIDFVYTGNDSNTNGAFAALEYAIDNEATYPADIVSSSYGACEPEIGSSDYASLNAVLEQAASQGQTVIAAAGDDGSTDCDGEYTGANAAAENEQLAVDFPGSSQYVTSMGGTEFPVADIAPGSSYFDAESSTDIISSAKSYIPEQVWNDDAGDVSLGATTPSPISSGGGGVSIYTARPSWQTGIPGIPSSGNRFVPDISLYASPSEPDVAADTFYGGYLLCSSDSALFAPASDGEPAQTTSCTNGFRDSNDLYLTVAGGTSFDAPIFSGMLAIINQAKGYSSTKGQGTVNPTLYSLASTATTYASAFHDITSGGNQCLAGTTYCGTGPQTTDYAAGTGYDEASGLGSVDLDNLLTAWPTATGVTATTFSSTTTLTAATLTPTVGATDTITITVASASTSSTAVPTGSISLSVNGAVVNADLALVNGVATYTFSSTTAGSSTITATYSGDTVYSASTGSITLNVGGTASSSESIALTATGVTVAPGASGTGTISVTPANGYTGTVNLAVSNPSALPDGCIVISPAAAVITGTAAVSATYMVYTSSSTTACTAAGAIRLGGTSKLGGSRASLDRGAAPHSPQSPWRRLPVPATFAGAFLLVCFRRRSKLLRAGMGLGLVLVFALSGLGLTGCGGSGTTTKTTTTTTSTSVDTPAGAYTITVTGTDSVTSTITSSASFTVTVS